jgi:4-amino-4-deoxy-L-arabinose transferase-like glycosyltransferase
MKYSKYYFYGIYVLIVLLFCYFRLTIINSGNVAYTYDQGRDFLAGARIIVDKNPVFIGPTTGIGGLFHGACWYYFTALSYLILGANPISYYHFLFVLHLSIFVLWMLVTKKYFGSPISILSSLIIASSPYYISSQTFAGNNILTIPSFTLFCLTLIGIIFSKENLLSKMNHFFLAFSLGATAGFVAETELSFGLFLAPSLMALFALSGQMRRFILTKVGVLGFLSGIIIPFLPRLLFELKNGFLQTKILLGFFTKPKLYNPRSYSEVLSERVWVFKNYIEQSVGSNFLVWIGVFGLLVLTYLVYKKLSKKDLESKAGDNYQNVVLNFSILLSGLFVFCLVYRDPFWGNYYEGIQVGFLVLFSATVMSLQKISKKLFYTVIIISFLLFIPVFINRANATISYRANMGGLKLQQTIIEHIVRTQKDRNEKVYCARVFTPPVIPHTYDYLWFYHYQNKDVETPRYDFVNNKCWYIIEPEWKGYEFRLTKWKEDNIPKEATLIKNSEKVIEGITIAEYKLNEIEATEMK